MFTAYRRYFDFAGRSSRKEYWLFRLTQLLLLGGSLFLGAFLIDQGDQMIGPWLFLLVCFGSLIPELAVSVRRMHDLDRSGFWLLIGLLPVVGGFILFFWFISEGDRGSNKFGPDPLGRTSTYRPPATGLAAADQGDAATSVTD